jgi:hypothetical protein
MLKLVSVNFLAIVPVSYISSRMRVVFLQTLQLRGSVAASLQLTSIFGSTKALGIDMGCHEGLRLMLDYIYIAFSISM